MIRNMFLLILTKLVWNLKANNFKNWEKLKKKKKKFRKTLAWPKFRNLPTKNYENRLILLGSARWFQKWYRFLISSVLSPLDGLLKAPPARQCRQQLTFHQNPKQKVPRIVHRKFQLNRSIFSDFTKSASVCSVGTQPLGLTCSLKSWSHVIQGGPDR